MPGKTQLHSDAVLDLVATSHYVALFTSAPPDDDSAGGAEVTAAGYSRQAFAPGAKFTDADGHTRCMSNAGAITFGPAAADWPTVSHFGIVSATGVVKYTAPLSRSKAVQMGDKAVFDPGTLVVKED